MHCAPTQSDANHFSLQLIEDAIKAAIKTKPDAFTNWINWDQLAMGLEKHELLDRDSREKMFSSHSAMPCSRKTHYFLYELLPSKGSSAYTRFFRALNEEQEHLGHKELVKLILTHDSFCASNDR